MGSGLDNVHVRDIIHADGPVAGHSRPALLLPDTLTVCDALRHLRQQRQQMALVVDEQGGVEGIITLEDLVEEVVGEIDTDTDTDLQAVIHQSDGAMLLPGTFPIHDLPDLGVHLPDTETRGPYVTIAGLLLAHLGHIPTQPGAHVTVGRYTAGVTAVNRHAITQVRLHPISDDHPSTITPPPTPTALDHTRPR